MKFQVGEKVKYNSNDWCFYGTIGAVIENSISPSYRINVDRMEKKNCKLTITQFEFELDADTEMSESKENYVWKKYEEEFFSKQIKTAEPVQVIAPEPVQVILPEPVQVVTPQPVQQIVPEPVKVVKQPKPVQQIVPEPVQVPVQQIVPEPVEEIIEATPEPDDAKPRRKRYGSWDTNFDLYRTGHKSKVLNTWMYQNRKQYQTGTLKQEQFDKLMQINFPFEAAKKERRKSSDNQEQTAKIAKEKRSEEPKDIWHKQLRQWKLGDSRASLQHWRQLNVKRFVEGKLSKDKIEKLKEVGILK